MHDINKITYCLFSIDIPPHKNNNIKVYRIGQSICSSPNIKHAIIHDIA